jgi:hypothetical protein
MAYTTLALGTSPMQNKTEAFLPFEVEGVDVYLWWSKSGGSANGKLKATIVRPDASVVTAKLAEDGDVALVHSAPTPQVKVLLKTADLTKIGTYKVFFEFKIDAGWISAVPVTFTALDDPTVG